MTDPRTANDAVTRGRDAATRHQWSEALEVLGSVSDDALSPDDLAILATAAYLVGDVGVAIDALERAYSRSLDSEDRGGAVTFGFWAVFILMNRGSVAQAGGWIARVTALLDEMAADAPQHAYLLALEGFRAVALEHEYERGHSIADRLVDLARASGDRSLLALGLNIDGRALVRSARIEEGMARLDEAMVEILSGTVSPIVSGTVYCSMIEACEEIAERRRAQEWTEALTSWCERQQGMLTFQGQCRTHRATILRHHGRWAEAAAEAELARQRFEGAADEPATGRAWYERAEIHRLSGELDAALAAYETAASWGHDPHPGLARLRFAQGDAEAAVSGLRRRLVETELPIQRVRLLPALVDVLVGAGDVEGAGEATAELEQLAERYGTAVLDARAGFARGSIEMAGGNAAAALPPLRAACERWRTLGDPYEEARTHELIAEACRAVGDRDAAEFEHAAARRLLADLRGDTNEQEGGDDHGLSPREREVLGLVATGMTNAQIADELFLATKTIDRHVGNILTKLGVPTRTAATAYAYEHGLI